MSTGLRVLSGGRVRVRVDTSRRKCASCGTLMPPFTKRGRKPEHCATERCTRIHRAGRERVKCGRCGERLPRGRAYQRAAICGKCFVDLYTLAGGT